ncbi:hypothetical protein OUQ99_18490 [Streptomonospora nanhaiensis]|uniref:Uncharacterized protein n=1 Tax=Streptomonospora nanhaiensis TaxID=1323731 RepID=A0ABY6YG36_9ACTN|nr:hypothetical protein [Streptomonospora nanhaiensis]WAE71219.1 hypothetical protein OUQ99_18490 [Streptomonospora nanhaiensis]
MICCLDAATDAWTAADGAIPLSVPLDRAMGTPDEPGAWEGPGAGRATGLTGDSVRSGGARKRL